MRSTQDPIAGLKQKLLDWGVTTDEELKSIDKDARSMVDEEVAAANALRQLADHLLAAAAADRTALGQQTGDPG